MLYREIIAVCSQTHTKHINTLCGQKVELLNVKLAVSEEFKPGSSVQDARCTFRNRTFHSVVAVIWLKVTNHRTSS